MAQTECSLCGISGAGAGDCFQVLLNDGYFGKDRIDCNDSSNFFIKTRN